MLYPISENGLVVNEAKKDKLQKQYIPLINDIVEISRDRLNENLRSIYVRGSVSVGRAIPNVSDIDIVVFVKESIEKQEVSWFSSKAKELENNYPFVTFVDITVITLDELLSSAEFSNLKVYLKTQSFCIEGEDMLTYLPDIKPGPGLAMSMYGENLIKELLDLQSVFSGTNTVRKYHGETKPIQFWCIWTMRVLIRSGLGLVMIRKPVYSQDLRTCVEVFNSEYPEYSSYMTNTLELALKPSSDREYLTGFLNEFMPRYIELWKGFINK